MPKEYLQKTDFEFTMFEHLYNEYRELVLDTTGNQEKLYHRLQQANTMLEAWKTFVPKSEYAAKKYITNFVLDYQQLYYWKGLLDKYLGNRYAEHKQAEPKQVKYPAGYEQAFQAIVLQSVSNIPEADEAVEKAVEKAIDWSKFCHLHEALRKTWDIELSTDFYTDYSGEPKKLQHRAIKDNPQA
jgi:hypothetical protein